MKRIGDFILVIVLAVALLATAGALFVSRLGGISWLGSNKSLTAYELITEEQKQISDLNILKADYAQSVVDYQDQLKKINTSTELSELEKTERKNALDKFYSKDYFNQKLNKIEQKQAIIDSLEKQKCRFTCADPLS